MITFALDTVESPNYDPTKPLVTDDTDIFLEEIKMLLDTDEEQVMGAMNMNFSLEKFIWKNDPDLPEIRQHIIEGITQYSILAIGFNIGIDVRFAKGTKKDVVLVAIQVSKITTPTNVKSLRVLVT